MPQRATCLGLCPAGYPVDFSGQQLDSAEAKNAHKIRAEKMDSVTVAFELMRMELDAEVENLNTEGAKFFRASMYADAEDLITKGKALQAFLDKVRALEMEWTSSFAATVDAEPADPVIEETARKILSGSKASKTALLVRFPNGDVLAKEKAADTLVEVIQHAGMEQVEAIGIMVNGENIVSRLCRILCVTRFVRPLGSGLRT
jgi:hypothetical protein